MDGSLSPLDDAALAALEDDITHTWGHINAATSRFLTLVAAFDRAEGWARHGLDYHYDDDGALVLSARLPPEVGAVVRQAIEAAMKALTASKPEAEMNATAATTNVTGGGRASAESCNDEFGEHSPAARRADALRLLAEQYLAAEAERQPAAAERFRVVVHVDAEALRDDAAGCDGRCEIEDGPALASDTARRLACDANVVALLTNREGEVLDVGRRTRTISFAMRRALQARDGGCRFPGCDRTHFTEGHHVRHWADGGQTKLSNLVTLCGYHHRLVHEGGFGVRATDDGLFVFSRPDGSRIAAAVGFGFAACIGVDAEAGAEPASRFRGSVGHPVAPAFDHAALAAAHADLGLVIDADTARTRWRGEPMDYGLAAEALWRGRFAQRSTRPVPS
jgi:hypothetical protein